MSAHHPRFADRYDAGRQLGEALHAWAEADPVVIGIARGGLEVAYEVARELGAPLDFTVARKIGAPANPEYAIGALGEGGIRVLDERVVEGVNILSHQLAAAIETAEDELSDRLGRYRSLRPAVDVSGRVVILVDDGLATGSSARAALRSLRSRDPARLILATPVASREAAASLTSECDEVVCLLTPEPMRAVGEWYERFDQTTDAQVRELLAKGLGAQRP